MQYLHEEPEMSNKTWKGVLCNTVHKIHNGLLCNLLSMCLMIYDLSRMYFVVDQYGWKTELPEKFSASLPYQILKIISPAV